LDTVKYYLSQEFISYVLRHRAAILRDFFPIQEVQSQQADLGIALSSEWLKYENSKIHKIDKKKITFAVILKVGDS
jgi:hypothetical protein